MFITPDWPAPGGVRALSTTRAGGVSTAPYDSLNLGTHVGDATGDVARNRQRLAQAAGIKGAPRWLRQVHGRRIVDLDLDDGNEPAADGAITARAGTVCAILTADCLPILLCARTGTRVGALHAGWRGLAAGIVEAGVDTLACAPGDILAWLGPAIGAVAYEVGAEVRAAFVDRDPASAAAFAPGRPGHWYCDLAALARARLACAGVTAVFGGDTCTHSDPARFFSHRRDGVTGRMATLIWLDPHA
ncbi:MAG: peptidoglycan editing factor PgeF [Gammaproteobacteria bacterium]